MTTSLFLLAALLAAGSPPRSAPGPGAPDTVFAATEVGKILSAIPPEVGEPPTGKTAAPALAYKHGTALMHDGWLVIPYANGAGTGGLGFFDISDPRAPRLVGKVFDHMVREGHSVGASWSYPYPLLVTQASYGFQVWDVSDVRAVRAVVDFHLPDIVPSDYDNGLWWLFLQAPYVFGGGSSRGLYVVDLGTPEKPALVAHVPISETGGFRIGSVLAVGNLLIVAANDQPGVATLDIGDPTRPRLLASDLSRSQYSAMVNGDRVYLAGSQSDNGLHIYDISDPSRIAPWASMSLPDKAGYLSLQDGRVHVGDSLNGYVAIDARDPKALTIVGRADFAEADADLDFVSVVGHLAVLGDDDAHGTRIVAHEAKPDRAAPEVTMVNPAPDAVAQPLTSRVGITLSDAVDLRSVSSRSFVVRPIGGAALAGKYSGQTGIVNFSPDEPLNPGTTYEVVVPAGGIRDLAQNVVARPFKSRFSTGDRVFRVGCELHKTEPTLVGEVVTFEVRSCTSDDFTFTWRFGDGGTMGPSPAREVSHRFTEPGRHTVILRAIGVKGRTSASIVHTVSAAPTTVAATRSSRLALAGGDRLVWLVNPDHDSVAAVDLVTYRRVHEVAVGLNPVSLAVAGDGALWVACRGDDSVRVVDPETAREVRRIDLPRASQPIAIVMSPAGGRAYVSLYASGHLVELDTALLKVGRTVTVAPTPRGIAVTHDGQRIFVTRFISPEARGEVVEVAAATLTVARVIPLRFDPGPDSDSSGRGVPNYLFGATVSPDGRELWVPAKKDNTGRGLMRSGEKLTFENTVRSMVSRIGLAGSRELEDRRRDLDNRALPSAVAFTPRGDFALVATLASNAIDVLDARSGVKVTSIEGAGKAPTDLLVTRDGGRLLVDSELTRELLVYDLSDLGQRNLLARVAAVATVPGERMDEVVLRGKRVFHDAADPRMAKDGYLSCAVCHFEGDSDGRVWDFSDRGEGLRNTISLVGRAGMRQGPLHWSANFDEVQDFEHDIRGAFGGRGFLPDAEFHRDARDLPLGGRKTGIDPSLDALAAYLSSLDRAPRSPYRTATGEFTDDAVMGAKLFRDLACDACHAGPELSDSRGDVAPFVLHDVGTLKAGSGKRLGASLAGVDTPGLLGVWASPPYFHDGSAATLHDAIAAPGHAGRVLSQAEISQLTAYLQELESADHNCTGTPPDRATGPAPADGDFAACRDVKLRFRAAPGADSYDVYLSTSPPGDYRGRVAATSFDPGPLLPWTNYYWRVDAVRGACVARGQTWRFAVRSGEGVSVANLSQPYEAGRMAAGERYYSDRPFTIVKMPRLLEGMVGIRTRNDDRGATASPWFEFDVDVEVDVLIAYDARFTSLPTWMNDFFATGLAIELTQGARAALFKKTFPPGRVRLGGNAAVPAAGAAGNYFVVLSPTLRGSARSDCD